MPRALLGVPADEIHVCGEAAAVNLVQELLIHSGEELEVKTYNRLTKLVKETKAVESLSNIQPGDCIVCFNKQDIYSVSRGLETLGVECAVIYGSLPPGKAKFNMRAYKTFFLIRIDFISIKPQNPQAISKHLLRITEIILLH